MGNMSKAHTVDDDIYMMIYSRYLNTFTCGDGKFFAMCCHVSPYLNVFL